MLSTDSPFKRVNTKVLYPKYLEKVKALIDFCAKQGFHYVCTSGLRDYEEQDKLYAIGRTTGKLGHKVTNAKGGQSGHNFGTSTDWCLDLTPGEPGLKPSWALHDLMPLANNAAKFGLESGAFWKTIKDTPHIQFPNREHGIKWAQLDQEYRHGGYPAVFAYLDKFPW